MGTADVKPSAAAELTPLLKERPSAAEAKAWCEDNLPRLPADQRAAILGLTPRGALQYDADPVPAALLESAGATATMVAVAPALSNNAAGTGSASYCNAPRGVSPRIAARWSAGSLGRLSSHHAFASAAEGLSLSSGVSSAAALGLTSAVPMRIQIHARLQPARCSGRP